MIRIYLCTLCISHSQLLSVEVQVTYGVHKHVAHIEG